MMHLNNKVKFKYYTGRFPNLCSGVLALEINEKEYKFGHDYSAYKSWETDGNYPEFWSSGGNCGLIDDYKDEFCHQREWEIDVERLPEEIRQYASEIDEVFNANVEYGCCGGCL